MTEWKVESIGDVCSFITDGSHNPPKGISQSEYFMLSSRDIQDGHLVVDNPRFLSKNDFEIENKRTKLQLNDVLLTTVGTIGRTAIYRGVPEKVTFQRSVSILRPMREKITPQYLKYFFDSITHVLTSESRGVAQQGIYLNQLKRIKVSYPPLPEQQEIVEILEDHLTHLDAALADVKQAKLKAGQFKVAFLRNVFSGDTGWNSIPMKQLGKWSGGGTPSKSNQRFWAGGTVPWLSPKDMGPQEITHTLDKITEEACANSTAKKIPENAVVFVVRSGILERKLPIALTKIETTLNQDMKALTFSDKVNPKFGFYSILALEQDILRTCRKSGTTVASINTESLMNYEIKVPSLPVQAEILDYVEPQLTLIDNSVPQLESVLKFGNSLRRSLLQAAFTGQLTKEVASV